jgi:hypothetical protein
MMKVMTRDTSRVVLQRVSSGTAVLLEKLEVDASARAVKASIKIGMRSTFM